MDRRFQFLARQAAIVGSRQESIEPLEQLTAADSSFVLRKCCWPDCIVVGIKRGIGGLEFFQSRPELVMNGGLDQPAELAELFPLKDGHRWLIGQFLDKVGRAQ